MSSIFDIEEGKLVIEKTPKIEEGKRYA